MVRPERKCASCGGHNQVESVTVRLYRKRRQVEFRYIICHFCTQVLESILETNSHAMQKSFFDHSAGLYERTR
jgi:hypothetical protein